MINPKDLKKFIPMTPEEMQSRKSLVDLIKKTARIDDRSINDVQIFDKFSFVSVPFEKAETIIHSFKDQNKGKKDIVTKAKPKKK